MPTFCLKRFGYAVCSLVIIVLTSILGSCNSGNTSLTSITSVTSVTSSTPVAALSSSLTPPSTSSLNTLAAGVSVSDLVVDPKSPHLSELVKFSFKITNTGSSEGIYNAILKITELLPEEHYKEKSDSTNEYTQNVAIAPGQSQTLEFTGIYFSLDGVFKAAVEDQVKIFEVGC